MVHEGWVYFKCEPAVKKKGWAKPEHYITIELGVKDMPPEQQKTSLHKKNHVLMLCYHYNWHELEYIKNEETVQTYKCTSLKKIAMMTYNENICY